MDNKKPDSRPPAFVFGTWQSTSVMAAQYTATRYRVTRAPRTGPDMRAVMRSLRRLRNPEWAREHAVGTFRLDERGFHDWRVFGDTQGGREMMNARERLRQPLVERAAAMDPAKASKKNTGHRESRYAPEHPKWWAAATAYLLEHPKASDAKVLSAIEATGTDATRRTISNWWITARSRKPRGINGN